MKKQIEFFVSDKNQLAHKVIDYFKKYGFEIVENNEDHIKFGYNSFFIDTWITNPLMFKLLLTGFIRQQ